MFRELAPETLPPERGSLRERSYDVSAGGEGEESRGEGPSPLEATGRVIAPVASRARNRHSP